MWRKEAESSRAVHCLTAGGRPGEVTEQASRDPSWLHSHVFLQGEDKYSGTDQSTGHTEVDQGSDAGIEISYLKFIFSMDLLWLDKLSSQCQP